MSIRTWLYEALSDQTDPLPHTAGERVFAKKTMTSAIEEHPYIVYKLGNTSDAQISENLDAGRQYIQIFVHDFSDGETGDYMRIDDVLQAIKDKLRRASSAEDGVINCLYLETSQDLNDDTLNTVFRYARFVAAYKTRE